MRGFLVVFGLLASSAAFAQSEMPPSGRGPSALIADFNFILGEKYLDHDDWGGLDTQLTTGIETNWRMPGWRVGIAADGLFSNAEERRNEFTTEEVLTRASTLELALGLRAVVPFGRVWPQVAGGAALVQGDQQVIRRAQPDDAAGAGGLGWWASGGLFARLGKTANVGISVRWSQARVKSGQFDVDAGGMTYGISAGFGIPAYVVKE